MWTQLKKIIGLGLALGLCACSEEAEAPKAQKSTYPNVVFEFSSGSNWSDFLTQAATICSERIHTRQRCAVVFWREGVKKLRLPLSNWDDAAFVYAFSPDKDIPIENGELATMSFAANCTHVKELKEYSSCDTLEKANQVLKPFY